MKRFLIIALLAFPAVAQVNLPVGAGWHRLDSSSTCGSDPCADSKLINVFPENDPHGMCTDSFSNKTGIVPCTQTGPYSFQDNAGLWMGSWSGGACSNDANPRCWVFGGGHTNSGNNVVMQLAFGASGAVPSIFVSPSKVCSTNGPPPVYVAFATNTGAGHCVLVDDERHTTYPAGNTWGNSSPPSLETYAGLVYDPSRGTFFEFGGSPWHNGGFAHEVYELDTRPSSPTIGEWQLRTSTVGGNYGLGILMSLQ